MKILVLGGCGIQGKAAVADLVASDDVKEVICADARPVPFDRKMIPAGHEKIRMEKLDAGDCHALGKLFEKAHAVIDLLPRRFLLPVCEAAIKSQVPVVNTNYAYPILALDKKAKSAGVAIMAECGLDPGIDLVIYGKAGEKFDRLFVVNSYCGGFPEPAACDNPLKYKISWTWEGVLSATVRDSVIIKNGKKIEIPAARQHDEKFVHNIHFPGLGALEAIPNGNAVFFTDLMGVTDTIKETGRYSLRWPGWSAFWRPLKFFGFLSKEPVAGIRANVPPYEVLDKLMGPKLQYGDDEKDFVAMINIFEGISRGKKIRWTTRVFIERDTDTGIMAMNKGVAWPASIAAKMLAKGEIKKKGVLSPITHIPYDKFIEELGKKEIHIDEEEMAFTDN